MTTRHKKATAVVLHKSLHDTGRYLDLVVLTKEFGKMRIKVRGAKQTHSKLAPLLEPFYLLHMDIYSHTEEVHILTGASIIATYAEDIAQDFDKISVLWKTVEVLDRFSQLDDQHTETFDIAIHSIAGIASQHAASYVWFLLQVLYTGGFISVVKRCSLCGNSLENSAEIAIVLTDWSFHCAACSTATHHAHTKSLPFPLLKVCMFGMSTDVDTFMRIALSDNEWTILTHLLEQTCEYIAGVGIKSFKL